MKGKCNCPVCGCRFKEAEELIDAVEERCVGCKDECNSCHFNDDIKAAADKLKGVLG